MCRENKFAKLILASGLQVAGLSLVVSLSSYALSLNATSSNLIPICGIIYGGIGLINGLFGLIGTLCHQKCSLMIHFIMSMVIMAFSVIIAILSLCILTKNQNLHNLNEIVLANIKNLQSQRAPENFQKMTEDFENGVEIIDAKISNATEDAEEFEYPSTYYSEPGFISQDEHYVLTYQYGYDLVDILYPTRSPQKMDVEDQISAPDILKESKKTETYPLISFSISISMTILCSASAILSALVLHSTRTEDGKLIFKF